MIAITGTDEPSANALVEGENLGNVIGCARSHFLDTLYALSRFAVYIQHWRI